MAIIYDPDIYDPGPNPGPNSAFAIKLDGPKPTEAQQEYAEAFDAWFWGEGPFPGKPPPSPNGYWGLPDLYFALKEMD